MLGMLYAFCVAFLAYSNIQLLTQNEGSPILLLTLENIKETQEETGSKLSNENNPLNLNL